MAHWVRFLIGSVFLPTVDVGGAPLLHLVRGNKEVDHRHLALSHLQVCFIVLFDKLSRCTFAQQRSSPLLCL
jgi:hypothetical protein